MDRCPIRDSCQFGRMVSCNPLTCDAQGKQAQFAAMDGGHLMTKPCSTKEVL